MPVETLGRYRIEKELGRGAMGRVFLAYDTQIQRRVAIKTIHAFDSLPRADRAEARERFLREARAAGRLLHPGIVTVFDVGEADGIPYLAMEHVEGTTIDVYCRPGDLLPLPTVVALVAHAAEALAFAHARGVVHRDVKPANLMRVGTTSVKVMDFGLAKSATSNLTQDGALFGTPNYMSPEQVRGEKLDGRSDLFSLGVVLYEMLTGAKPFGGDSVSSVLYRIVHEPPTEPALHLDRVPADVAAIVRRALAKRREDRFADGLELASVLRRAIAGEAPSPAPRVRPRPRPGAALPAPADAGIPPPSRARSRGSLFPYVVGAVFVAAALGGAWLWMSGRSFAPPAPPPLEARVRTEPPGLPVRLDGVLLADGVARFSAGGPFGVLSVSHGCREASHPIEAQDAGREIVLAVDPIRADVDVDAGVPGGTVAINAGAPASLPARFDLDLCRDNRLEVIAPGFRAAVVAIPSGATPLEARTAAAGIRLASIPKGAIALPASRLALRYFVDGDPVPRGKRTLELSAGTHQIRAVSEEHFIDVAAPVEVPEGGTASPSLTIPPLAALVVQTFPPEASVTLVREGGAPRAIGETPLKKDVAAGVYTVRVQDKTSGAGREQRVTLRAGANPPVRISFGDAAR